MKVIILCAGIGSRLNLENPKGLIKIREKTLLEICLGNFLLKGIKKKKHFFWDRL